MYHKLILHASIKSYPVYDCTCHMPVTTPATRPATSPASAGSFFFVKKKEGGLRPCFDYQGLHDDSVKL